MGIETGYGLEYRSFWVQFSVGLRIFIFPRIEIVSVAYPVEYPMGLSSYFLWVEEVES
jgi:hypothetical protein